MLLQRAGDHCKRASSNCMPQDNANVKCDTLVDKKTTKRRLTGKIIAIQ